MKKQKKKTHHNGSLLCSSFLRCSRMHRQPWRLLHSLHRTEAQRAHRSKLLPNASILIRYGYHLAALKRKAFASSKGSHRCCMHEKEKQQHQRRRRRLPCMGCPLGKSSRKHNCTSDKRNNKKKQKQWAFRSQTRSALQQNGKEIKNNIECIDAPKITCVCCLLFPAFMCCCCRL